MATISFPLHYVYSFLSSICTPVFGDIDTFLRNLYRHPVHMSLSRTILMYICIHYLKCVTDSPSYLRVAKTSTQSVAHNPSTCEYFPPASHRDVPDCQHYLSSFRAPKPLYERVQGGDEGLVGDRVIVSPYGMVVYPF